MNKYCLSALVAAGLLAGGLTTRSASAADLGGDCCADLEERVAELEATTARKGNRKVSLTITGFVNEQVMYWDDGIEQNVYQIGGGSTGLASNVKFTGTAQIVPGWTAGYLLHMELETANSLGVNANQDDVGSLNNGTKGFTSDVSVMQSYWFLKSDTYGKLSVGQLSQATDNTAILVDGSGSLVQANWVAYEANSFAVRRTDRAASGLVWGNAGSCRGMGGAFGDCNGVPSNGVRYDSPTFSGFSVSASWGEDDFWGVSGRWAGEISEFKIAAAAGYNESNEHFGISGFPNGGVGNNTLNYFQAGVYVQHIPTGLFVLYNYGNLSEDRDSDNGRNPPPDADTHFVKAGIRTLITPLGHTVFYGEYLNTNDGSTLINGAGGSPTSSELQRYGGGIVQEIDAASMSVYIKYRKHTYDDNTAISYEDFDYVSAGALINF